MPHHHSRGDAHLALPRDRARCCIYPWPEVGSVLEQLLQVARELLCRCRRKLHRCTNDVKMANYDERASIPLCYASAVYWGCMTGSQI